MIRFIDEYRNRFSVEFICQTLNIHREGGFLTSRGYRQSKVRGLSPALFATLFSWSIFAMFMLKITASTACGRCGAYCNARALTLAASTQPG